MTTQRRRRNMRSCRDSKGILLAIVLALGCAPKSADEDGGTGGTDGTGDDGSQGDDGSGDDGSGGDGGGSDNHGYAKIQLLRAGNMDHSPFGGTDTIRALVMYGAATSQCLVEFYRANPDWRDDGVGGGPIFEAWTTKVCQTQDEDESIPCDSATIWQSGLDEQDEIPYLNFEYHVSEGASAEDLENHVLIVGPLPTAQLADCDGGALPTVSISAGNITGQGSEGGMIWQGTSCPEYMAQTNQGLPMKVRVADAG
jgi:hypothetical protein